MYRRSFIKASGTAGLITLISPRKLLKSFLDRDADLLEKRFLIPRNADYPQVMWFWMNGHVSKEGITADMEAMKNVGVGGVFNFDAGISIPQGPVEYFSKKWVELKNHAIKEAQRLGLDFTIHNCPGWSSSGGPWITPELAMQQLTWSEVYIPGGGEIDLHLPTPFHKLNYYRDAALLAYPSLAGEVSLADFKVQSNRGPVARESVTGQDTAGLVITPSRDDGKGWLRFEFDSPREVRSVTFLITTANSENEDPGVRTSVGLEASFDGVEFNSIATISTGAVAELIAGEKFITYDIEPTTAKYFRFITVQPRRFSQIRFSAIVRLQNFMEKTGNRFMFSGENTSPLYHTPLQQIPESSIIRGGSVLDISQFMDADGRLKWRAPEGNWTIMRFGYTPTGSVNKAAPENGVGLECDKFSQAAIDFHFNKMQDKLPFLHSRNSKIKLGLEIDSYEAGAQTWTKNFPDEFLKRRRYDVKKYLPTLTGRVIDDVDHTERFLWDFRRTQADLIADNYYGRFAELCSQHGFTSYVEPYDKGPFEEMRIGSKANVPMGEFWYGLSSILQGNLVVRRTPKLVASIAHTNGHTIAAAEAFTSEPDSSSWQEYPFALKAVADKMFTLGINNMIIHRFAHQPNLFATPGMTMGPWGIHFDRTNTWFAKAKSWLTYLARCQAMLQQGLPVTDLAYFAGEEANVFTRVNRNELNPVCPEGYDYDVMNAQTILNKVQIKNGLIHLPDGTSYRALVLQDYRAITLELLTKLRDLVMQGMMLIGEAPQTSLGLSQRTDEVLFNKIVNELWSKEDTKQKKFGKGFVIRGNALPDVLQNFHVPPDFEFTSLSGDAPLLYIHRKTADADIYFVCNQRRTYEETVCSFRIKNKQPEIWNPVTGEITQIPFYETVEDKIRLPLRLTPYGSMFVIFRSSPVSAPLTHVERDKKIIIDAGPQPTQSRIIFPDVSNQFSITLWAKPEMNIMTKPSQYMGEVKHPYTDHYAIYPSAGNKLYGAGHATCGLAIGRNGIAVWENENYPVAVLTSETRISGWTHVALLYNDGIPSVCVNGKLIGTGRKSMSIVHPGLGHAYLSEGASYYNGDMTEPQLSNKLLTNDIILRLANETPAVSTSPFHTEIISHNNKPALLIFENGEYRLVRKFGGPTSFVVNKIGASLQLTEEWEVEFPPNHGAPEKIMLPQLLSLHKHTDERIRHFSGTATYKNHFILNRQHLSAGDQFFLDLGRVEVIAEVIINGKSLGVLWSRPYRINVTQQLKEGRNDLVVRVTNLWPNRLIGDEALPDPNQYGAAASSGFEQLIGSGFANLVGQPISRLPDWYIKGMPKPKDGRVTFSTWKHYKKDDPLLESGLIGPVVLRGAIIHPF